MAKKKTLTVSEELNRMIEDAGFGESTARETPAEKSDPTPGGPLGRLDPDDGALLKRLVRTESGLLAMAQEKAREAETLAGALRVLQTTRIQTLRNILVTKYNLDPDLDYRIDENDVIWPVVDNERTEER